MKYFRIEEMRKWCRGKGKGIENSGWDEEIGKV